MTITKEPQDTPNISLAGELCGIFYESFVQKLPQSIKSVKYFWKLDLLLVSITTKLMYI